MRPSAQLSCPTSRLPTKSRSPQPRPWLPPKRYPSPPWHASTSTRPRDKPQQTGLAAHALAQQADIAALLSWNASGSDELDAEQALTAITAIIARERPSSSRTLFAAAQRGTAINDRLTSRVNALFSPDGSPPSPSRTSPAANPQTLSATQSAPAPLPTRRKPGSTPWPRL